MDFLLLQPFHIPVINLSANAMHLPKHFVVAYAPELLTSVIAASSTALHYSSVQNPESINPTTFSPKSIDTIAFIYMHSDPCKATKTTANGEAQQAKETTIDNQHALAAAVYSHSTVDRDLQIPEQPRIQTDAT